MVARCAEGVWSVHGGSMDGVWRGMESLLGMWRDPWSGC